MQEAGVQLVVPTGLHDAYPSTMRPHLMNLESFIGEVRVAGIP
jgi:EcoRII C terminal